METMIQKGYKEILRRQNKLEMELALIKKTVLANDESNIKPSVLKRWERISRDMDRGKAARAFNSVQEMKKWLKNL
ncbi:hypothetical protein A2W54_03400 [Candidatus Giovannonibacteria bacterium RIFCSPHIGHO2_02_43_13]|uniref:Uncharacterized protein n=1 Tax=Candidatus Giovannonibacteria bacterium RIFCSPHIGHO2_02_43_13 TaxID=1798330 RepID=A0A1F5WQ61_9BACT|nr:MAG: hypothetical protein UW28_C0004G0025 [Parcubacteria group bacterium GW2011_GWA2_44_13]OGF73932.1 MAG: hypothetical protein A3E06_00610 [Candidatus Giovannonibacteria bacterium RIFCSPHIGHO2_12_FULL_44_42]OGF77823.1 MAG: hypothetical protein A2W54_03400 [Candidatus Giovannonibacteria bacterium RIFCSPHIGHO2_02_43_13]OGF88842.1 MAG: hypothetical protein A3I94_02455 [Candidatus Giovannonibacteria bacterium RIFCSPLOWO2_02_FULL_43_54]OGF96806.1 MAG: hypothetical protein A3H08_01345 [Candidatus